MSDPNSATPSPVAPVVVPSRSFGDILGTVLSSGVFRRAVAFLLGLGFLFLHNKFGIDLSDSDKVEITALVGTYLLGSNAKEAVIAHADAKVAAAEAAKAPAAALNG